MYLIDTDVLIDVLRGMKEAKEFLLEIADEGLFISVITLSELLSGKETRDPVKKEKLLRFLRKHFQILPIDEEIGILGGEIRRDYNIGLGDAIIAATAIVHGLSVVTENIRHFSKVEGLRVIKPPYR
ncbi:type II toxin-antitoxin system VapC family toxin [Pyrococcus kukulkanii]|uniref:type II toxin-antitoxin system VapC family toxin n=1 Tax=Pyrococcus kukulkanii TaxID=1609559 RepID=UPI003568560C